MINKRFGCMLLVCLLFSQLFIVSYTNAQLIVDEWQSETDDENKSKYMVFFHEEIHHRVLEMLGVEIIYQSENLPVVTVLASAQAIQEIQKDLRVAYIEKDQRVQVSYEITNFSEEVIIGNQQQVNWGTDRLHAKNAWDKKLYGIGVKVAVLDTGIASHRDLKIAGGKSFVAYTKSYQDDNGHGTHVAGVIAGQHSKVLGVAPQASLYAVKVLDRKGFGDLSDIIAGVDWSISNKMDIVNLSLGSIDTSQTLEKLFEKGATEGIVFVAAAGNDGASIDDNVVYPASSEHVIAVAATTILDNRATFSAQGKQVEIAAPGNKITSTFLNNRYVQANGTSMATPHVTGVLALWKQQKPLATPQELRNLLAQHTIDLGVPGRDRSFGHGIVQVPFFDTPRIQYFSYLRAPFSPEQGSIDYYISPTTKQQLESGSFKHVTIQVGPTDPTGKSEERFFEFKSSSHTSYKPTDISNHWAYAQLRDFLHADLVKGYKGLEGQNFVAPNQSITRAEFTAIIVRALNLHSNGSGKNFRDVKVTDWHYEPIQIASQYGIVHGITESTFEPSRPITRAEIAVMIVRAYGASVSFEGVQKLLTDIDTHWGHNEISKATQGGLIHGYPDFTFRPDDHSTRAEAIAMVHRALTQEQTSLASKADIINTVLQYERQRMLLYAQSQTTGLVAVNAEYATGYYLGLVDALDSSLGYWHTTAKPVLAEDGKALNIVVQDITLQSNRMTKVQVEISMNLEFEQFSEPEQYWKHGTFSLRKMPDGSWKIFDYISNE
ncbi:hypothetical protein BHU72_12945 [Desulfuribacillus stibiiarsenatis]|uniref:SLH domain-containing protein n=1 Tax=Desulfuribacillus stibiiarsenatis TaxID=1390249 RepID=A0A1E5L994_9FIRM|nr:S8 family serine peptidase [Desulfuribacillus stibiiarsenatis]OEH86513.1 hypothetical protein BHU72_12945 [Desulfuribacillus stibiiarsenatis]